MEFSIEICAILIMREWKKKKKKKTEVIKLLYQENN